MVSATHGKLQRTSASPSLVIGNRSMVLILVSNLLPLMFIVIVLKSGTSLSSTCGTGSSEHMMW